MPSRIFLLEDDRGIVRVVRTTLGDEGWDVCVHGRIAGALQAFAASRADLALLDVELPDGEGFQVCAEIRADSAFRDVPIIFMTSRGGLEDRLHGFRAGAQDYIQKPFEVPELVARLRAHLALRAREDGLRREAEAATARERIRQDVFDMIIHDLRTPLTSIKVSLGMLRDGDLIDTATHARLQDISNRSLDQAMLMIDDLLDLKSRKLNAQRRPVDLAALFEKLRRMFQPQFERHGGAFRSLLAEDARQVCSDPSLLFRILVNLINNAHKYSPKGKAIELRASRSGPALLCEVLDEGPGIPDAEKELIFEKFYRTQEVQTKAVPGSGIGLAFCRLAAQALGGRVSVRDREGGGSCFVVEVPAEETPAPAPAVAPVSDAAALLGPELIREFLADCADQLRKLQDGLRAGQGPLSLDEIRALARAAHQFAGTTGTYGFPQAGAAAARLESLLRNYMSGQATDAGGLRAEALQAFDAVRAQLKRPA
ncbi:MAG: response regulator [Elusimicrobia bacterium]|nr:response regulator [Elusimicrobiota bacterium]